MAQISETEREFLEAIRDDRDDDTHRLIYADWLEEQGDPRAEFVRLQIELHALGKFADPKATYPIKKRISDIRLTSLAEVQQELMQMGATRFQYRRGVLDEVSIPARQLEATLPAVLDYAPALAVVQIPDLESVDQIKNISELEAIDELKTLIPHQSLGIDGMMAFVNRLGELQLRGLELNSHWRHQSDHISMRLLMLGLSRLGLKKLRVQMECSSPIDLDDSFEGLQSLRQVNFDGLVFSEQTWAAMAANMIHLEEFRSTAFAGDFQFPDPDQLRVVELPLGSESTFLKLARGERVEALYAPVLSTEGFHELMRLPLPALRTLRMRVSNETLRPFSSQLMEAPWFQQLHAIHIEGDLPQFDYLNYNARVGVLNRIQKQPGWQSGSCRSIQVDRESKVLHPDDKAPLSNILRRPFKPSE